MQGGDHYLLGSTPTTNGCCFASYVEKGCFGHSWTEGEDAQTTLALFFGQGLREGQYKSFARSINGHIGQGLKSCRGRNIDDSCSWGALKQGWNNRILRYDPHNPRSEDRDRFVLSKGHGCITFYAILADKGFFPTDKLKTFMAYDSILGSHPDRNLVPGVEASTGSLRQAATTINGRSHEEIYKALSRSDPTRPTAIIAEIRD
jgi:transketolase N-terminal domain/subunit